MKTAVIYARYSSDRQTEQSIEGQLRVCNEYASRNDITIVDTYIDRAMSGTNDNRIDFQRMLKDSHHKAWDYVLVYKLDRFSRNKYEMATHKRTLKENGIKILSAMENIPDTPEGIILESLLEGMAEYYSAELSQKVRRGMNESRQKGQFTGGKVLYGYKVENKKILIDEEKAEAIRIIFEKHASGMYVKDIIEYLTENGYLFNNKPFKINTVHNFLRNEKYAGIVRYKDEVFTNIYPAIVSKELFDTVSFILSANHYGRHPKDVRYLLKNKITCGYCGKPIASESGTSKNGSVMRYYKCSGRKRDKHCEKLPVRKDLLEELVVEVTFKIFDNPENLNFLADKILELHTKKMESDLVIKSLEKNKADIEDRLKNLLECMERGIVTATTKNRLEELENELSEINEHILVLNSKNKKKVSKEDIKKFIKTSLKKEPDTLIRLLVKKIILFDDKIQIFYNYTDNKNTTTETEEEFPIYSESFEKEIQNTKISGENYDVVLDVEALI